MHPGVQVAVLMLLLGLTHISIVSANRCPLPEDIMPCRCRGRNDQIQMWCSHSNLDRVNGALENLMRLRSMPAIDELIVENNKMPLLPARAFGALRIGRLLLRNNGLDSISRNAFAGLENSLEEIYIIEESLIDFPFDSIEQLRNLEAFTIEKSKIPLLPKFSGLNRLKHIRIDGSRINGLPVGAFAKMAAIKQIHVVNSNLTTLADGIFGPLDTLQLANFSGNQISSIQRRTFARLPKLEVLSTSKNRLHDAIAVGRACEELPSLKSLDISQNQFKTLPEGSFVHLRSLQLLNLAQNSIQTVSPRSFTHLPALRKVDFSSNQLRNLPKLFFDSSPLLEEIRMRRNMLSSANEIGEILNSLKSLRFLDLGHNGVTDLPAGTIADHSQLERIDLSDNLITRIHKDAFRNVPSLIELSLRNNSLLEMPSTEADSWKIPSLSLLDLSSNKLQSLGSSAFSSLVQLTRLDLSSNKIKAIGSLAFSGNSNLEELELFGNGLKSITFNTFAGLGKLKLLDLSKNHLEVIPSATFRDLGKLERLNLANNRISEISNDIFHGLKSLEELSMKSNLIPRIPTGIFASLQNLKDLNLKQNAIAQISPRAFSDLKNLRGLKLAANKISEIDDTAFDDLQKLKSVDLSSNRVTHLTARCLKNLVNLEKLDVRENRIATVENGALSALGKLQVIDFAQNALEKIPDLVKSASLRVADFSHNQIASLEANAFMDSKNLVELYLNDNKITTIQSQTFSKLEHLTILDLHGNDVVEIPKFTFQNLPRLVYIRLSRNKIRTVDSSAFSGLTALDGVDLQENELESMSDGAFEKSGTLKYLNLSHNNFDDMSRLGIGPLVALEVLDVSFNRLRVFDSKALRHLQWLVELRVNDNGICSLPFGVFDGMSRLKMLILKNNTISHLSESVFYKLKDNIAFLDLSGNPIVCDCELIWFRNLITREGIRELTDSTCGGPEILKSQSIKNVRPGRLICTNSKQNENSGNSKTEKNCPAMPMSKRMPRPIMAEPLQKLVFADTPKSDDVSESTRKGANDVSHVNRYKDEKSILSNDYVPGDSPTIYAGSISLPNTVPIREKVSSGGLSALSSLFGIPLPNLDFGLNMGISPSVSVAEKDTEDERPVSFGFKKDPLPPSWIERPSKGDDHSPVTYDPPQYIPRKPIQPYIPLNPYANADSNHFLPSIVSPKLVSKNSNGNSKWNSTAPPKTDWFQPYPTVETGFIPIEPFFHVNPSAGTGRSKNSTRTTPTPASSHSNFVSSTKLGNSRLSSTTPFYNTKEQLTTRNQLNKPTEPTFLVTAPASFTESSRHGLELNPEESEEGDSLSDFWGIFNSGNSTLDAPPVDFAAPIDTELNSDFESATSQQSDVSDPIQENRDPANQNPLTGQQNKGKSTITKVKLEDAYRSPNVLSSNSDFHLNPSRNSFVYTGSPQATGQKEPLVPPVLIGGAEEPLDWYYKNYDIQQNPEEEIEKYLDRSRANTLDDRVIDFTISTASDQIHITYKLLYVSTTFLIYLYEQ